MRIRGRRVFAAGHTVGGGWTVVVGDVVLWRVECCNCSITMAHRWPRRSRDKGGGVEWGRCHDSGHLRGVKAQVWWNPYDPKTDPATYGPVDAVKKARAR